MSFQNLPQIRSGLNVTELGNELIVFDSTTSNAHCLDKIGGAVFLACRDGESIETLEQKLGTEYSEETVQVALAQLEELSLLEESSGGVDRRKFLTVVGAGVAGVVVASVAAPSPVAAQSCHKCRLDPSTKIPCDCSTCGQSCSLANNDPVNGTACNSKPKGACEAVPGLFVCCFEYIRTAANPPAGEPNCFFEGFGDYGCRPVNDGTSFQTNCTNARASAATALYYCCCCSTNAPANRNCNSFC